MVLKMQGFTPTRITTGKLNSHPVAIPQDLGNKHAIRGAHGKRQPSLHAREVASLFLQEISLFGVSNSLFLQVGKIDNSVRIIDVLGDAWRPKIGEF